MFGEVIGTGKCLAAGVASVRPLARVDPQVAVHVALAAERPAAEFALERPLTRVFPDVQLQVLLGPEALAAERAQMGAPWVVLGRWACDSARNTTGTASRGRIDQRRTAGGGNGRGGRRSRRRRAEIADQIVKERTRSGGRGRSRCRRSGSPSGSRAFVARLSII